MSIHVSQRWDRIGVVGKMGAHSVSLSLIIHLSKAKTCKALKDEDGNVLFQCKECMKTHDNQQQLETHVSRNLTGDSSSLFQLR